MDMMVTDASGSNVNQQSSQINTGSSSNSSAAIVDPAHTNITSDLLSNPDEQHTATRSSSIPSHDMPTQTTMDQCIIGIKVRTLDHRSHYIRVSHDALVSELKERIELEIGVGPGRQRLIYRGKVLKNDQKITTYALEDGHVIHLVIRNSGDQEARERESASARINEITSPEDSPNMNEQSRILMGTIAIPSGSDLDIFFLRTLITSLMAPLRESSVVGDSTNEEDFTRISQQRESMNGTNNILAPWIARGTRVDENGTTISGLEARAEIALNAIASNLDNAAYEFQGLTHRSVSTEATERSTANLQDYLTRFQELFGRFQRRLNVLPLAIHASRSSSEDPQTIIATMRAIRTLGSLGEASQILCRISQLVFFTSPESSSIVQGDDELSASIGGTVSMRRIFPRPDDALYGVRNSATRRARYFGFNAGRRRSTYHADRFSARIHRRTTATTLQHEAPLTSSPILTSTPQIPHTDAATADSNTTSSVAGWNFRGFLENLFLHISISTAYGLLRGNPESVQQIFAEIRYGVQTGSFFPMVDPTSLNLWCDTLIENARTQLRQLSIPESITILLTRNDGEDFVAVLLHPIQQHLPHLMDQILLLSSDYSSHLTCLELIRAMLRRWLQHLTNRTQQRDNVGAMHFLVELFAHFGFERSLTQFVLTSLLKWIFPDMPTSITSEEATSRRRYREEDDDETNTVDSRSKRRCI